MAESGSVPPRRFRNPREIPIDALSRNGGTQMKRLLFLVATLTVAAAGARPLVSQSPTPAPTFRFTIPSAPGPLEHNKQFEFTISGKGFTANHKVVFKNEKGKTDARLDSPSETKLTGHATLPAGRYSAELLDGAAAKATSAIVVAPLLSAVWIEPKVLVPQSPIKVLFVGEGFDPSLAVASLFDNGSCSKGCQSKERFTGDSTHLRGQLT